MKTKIISTLKKELLIIELPTLETQISIGLHCIGIKPPPIGKEASDSNGFYHVYKEMFHGFKILGKPDEIKDEYVKEFVDKVDLNYGKRWCAFENYIISGEHFSSALESFHSALESEIYWVNPFGKPKETNLNDSFFGMQTYFNDEVKFDKAQEKTFDKSRTLIFVKN